MNAHGFAMLNLCVAFGFAVVNSMGVFTGGEVESRGGVFGALMFLTEPVFNIKDPTTGASLVSFSGIEALAGALALLTIVFLNSNFITDKGASMAVYAVIFYGSVFTIGLTVFKNFNYPGINLFYSGYVLLSSLAFVYMLVQMSSGGHKAHD